MSAACSGRPGCDIAMAIYTCALSQSQNLLQINSESLVFLGSHCRCVGQMHVSVRARILLHNDLRCSIDDLAVRVRCESPRLPMAALRQDMGGGLRLNPSSCAKTSCVTRHLNSGLVEYNEHCSILRAAVDASIALIDPLLGDGVPKKETSCRHNLPALGHPSGFAPARETAWPHHLPIHLPICIPC